ncbi:MAG TPA: 2-hydroxyglutaryl-CoA dehydratase, partial [Firmicutes bacterium]|nr:2-hydroxyglutaryl-CoA dehydratase [Bacillota bacterium]
MNVYLGADVGSVSTNMALVDGLGNVLETLYMRTQGQPVQTVQQALKNMAGSLPVT